MNTIGGGDENGAFHRRDRGCRGPVVQRGGECADDAESSVEPAASLDRIEVRAEQEGACCRVARGQDGRVVGGSIDSRLEPCGVGALEEPGARREMRCRERLSLDTAIGGRTDRSESVEVGS